MPPRAMNAPILAPRMGGRVLTAVLAALLCAAVIGAAIAQTEKPQPPVEKNQKNGKLPRFASLRSEDVNVRTGPGARYPVLCSWMNSARARRARSIFGKSRRRAARTNQCGTQNPGAKSTA